MHVLSLIAWCLNSHVSNLRKCILKVQTNRWNILPWGRQNCRTTMSWSCIGQIINDVGLRCLSNLSIQQIQQWCCNVLHQGGNSWVFAVWFLKTSATLSELIQNWHMIHVANRSNGQGTWVLFFPLKLYVQLMGNSEAFANRTHRWGSELCCYLQHQWNAFSQGQGRQNSKEKNIGWNSFLPYCIYSNMEKIKFVGNTCWGSSDCEVSRLWSCLFEMFSCTQHSIAWKGFHRRHQSGSQLLSDNKEQFTWTNWDKHYMTHMAYRSVQVKLPFGSLALGCSHCFGWGISSGRKSTVAWIDQTWNNLAAYLNPG